MRPWKLALTVAIVLLGGAAQAQELPTLATGTLADAPGMPSETLVSGAPLAGPFPGTQTAMVALGCFWGAERKFWEQKGVYSTAVGYAGGFTVNATFE